MTRRATASSLATALLAALALAAPSCRQTPPQTAGIDLQGMDKSVAPGDDFNEYTNGGWMKATAIPADKASYGIFAILADETRARNRALLEDAAKASNAGGDARKIGDYYWTFMDEAATEQKGAEP